MKKKILGIFVMMMLIVTAVLPVVGTINKVSDSNIFSSNHSEIQWSMTYGGDEADKFWDVEGTDDGGYIACGTTEESNNHYPWVLKVDSDGNEMWNWSITEYTVGGEVLEISYCWQSHVLCVSDGGYIITFTALQTIYNDETYLFGGLVKLNSDGDEEWINILGEGFEWTIHHEYLLEVEDGIVGAGAYADPLEKEVGEDKSGCIFKVNNNGLLEWHKEYDYGKLVDKLNGICATTDGGFLLAGCVGIVDATYYDGWLVKTDSQGEKEWEKIFSGPKNDVFWGCIQTDNGDYMMVGWTSSFGFGSEDAWVLRTDVNGNEIWNKTFGTRKMDIPYDFDFTDDGGVLFPVITDWTGITTDSWVINMDSDGNAEWKHVYTESSKQYFNGICSKSGGCIASGILGAWDNSKSDALLVKYAPMENQRPNKPATPTGSSSGTPDVEYTFSTSSSDPDGGQVMFRWDWGDGTFTDWLDTNDASHAWTTEDKFNVRVMAMDEDGGESDWSDPLPFSTPKSKSYINTLLLRFLENHPNIFSILRQLLNL